MRRLAWFALGYSGAVFLAVYLLPECWQLYIGLGLVLPTLGAWFRHIRDKQVRLRLRAALLLTGAAAGLLWSWGHWQLNIAPGLAHVGETRTITGVVLEYPTVYTREDYACVYLRVQDDELPRVKMVIYTDPGQAEGIRPGDLIGLSAGLLRVTERRGEESWGLTSRGIFLKGWPEDGPEVTGRWRHAWLLLPRELAFRLQESITAVFPADAAPFLRALLTGDRTALREDEAEYQALRTAGLLHVVAISGMHVAFLLGFVRVFTGRRRITAAVCIPLVLLFIPLTGAGPSVIRAAVIQIFVLAAPLLRRENDPVTALMAALLLLLGLNPQAAANPGLQLSFAAMAGIMLVTPEVFRAMDRLSDGTARRRKSRLPSGLVRGIQSSLSGTIGAAVFTTPLVALYFGFVPLYAALANLLVLWSISLLFMLGLAAALLGLIWLPAARVLGWVLAWGVRYVFLAAGGISVLPAAAIVTRHNLCAWWLVLSYLLFLLAWLFRGKGKSLRPIVPGCLSAIALGVCLVVNSLSPQTVTGQVTALDVGQGQCLALQCGSAAVMVDCGSSSGEDAGELAAAYWQGQGVHSLDALVLTHFHRDHADGAEKLLARMEVRRLILPVLEEEEDRLRADTLAAAEKAGTEIVYIPEDTELTVGDLTLTVFAAVPGSSSDESGLILLADYGEFEALITGDISSTLERALLADAGLPDIELLVAGHHGSRYSTCEALLDAVTPEAAVISVGRNSYGHPAAETLDRLAARNIEIYRTDESGDVTVRIE